MPKVTCEVDIQVWCSCGEGLCRISEGGEGAVTVSPCPKCLKVASEDGHERGYDKGYDDGHAEGQKEASE